MNTIITPNTVPRSSVGIPGLALPRCFGTICSPYDRPNIATHLGHASPGIPLELRGTVFGVMLVFIATLAIAYVYAWRKGVFKWR